MADHSVDGRIPAFCSRIVPDGSGRQKVQNRANALELLGVLESYRISKPSVRVVVLSGLEKAEMFKRRVRRAIL
jgi:hypothetical protein